MCINRCKIVNLCANRISINVNRFTLCVVCRKIALQFPNANSKRNQKRDSNKWKKIVNFFYSTIEQTSNRRRDHIHKITLKCSSTFLSMRIGFGKSDLLIKLNYRALGSRNLVCRTKLTQPKKVELLHCNCMK